MRDADDSFRIIFGKTFPSRPPTPGRTSLVSHFISTAKADTSKTSVEHVTPTLTFALVETRCTFRLSVKTCSSQFLYCFFLSANYENMIWHFFLTDWKHWFTKTGKIFHISTLAAIKRVTHVSLLWHISDDKQKRWIRRRWCRHNTQKLLPARCFIVAYHFW